MRLGRGGGELTSTSIALVMVRIEDSRRLPVVRPWLTSRMTTVGSASQRQKSDQGTAAGRLFGVDRSTGPLKSPHSTCITAQVRSTRESTGRQGTRLSCMHHTPHVGQ